jgi:hypothetical protein
MTLDVYFKSDLKQHITAITVAMLSSAIANGTANIEYCRGVIDSAKAYALLYGIPWTGLVTTIRAAIEDTGKSDLLELATRMLPGG